MKDKPLRHRALSPLPSSSSVLVAICRHTLRGSSRIACKVLLLEGVGSSSQTPTTSTPRRRAQSRLLKLERQVVVNGRIPMTIAPGWADDVGREYIEVVKGDLQVFVLDFNDQAMNRTRDVKWHVRASLRDVEADREIAVDHVTQLSRTNKSRSRGLGFRYAPVSLFFIVDRAVIFSVVSLSKHQVELLKSNLHQPSESHALVSCSLRSSQVHPSRHSFASRTLSDRLCQAELFPTSKPHVHSSSLTSHARLNHLSRTRKRPSRMPFPLDPSRLADLLFIQLVFESLSLFFVIFQPILGVQLTLSVRVVPIWCSFGFTEGQFVLGVLSSSPKANFVLGVPLGSSKTRDVPTGSLDCVCSETRQFRGKSRCKGRGKLVNDKK
ncbi:CACTA en-spm transposon protein [Cucumis melo var. makuwa]|uniref:CACTA en-spm transposon protein n=1 Tax=Cucumis melo var. makuwa TaxID=1194695 RepID=A0A5D3BAS6_CUCMM|nr:CACTA en-spm transposon protein [Cucumis melo var. makuwa]TYJ95585.1 CACTA en-spm transposon protein [Cucumis melo var. makuwa]